MPDCQPGIFSGAYAFFHGALHHGLQTWLRFDQFLTLSSTPPRQSQTEEELIQHLISFMAAG